MTQSAPAPPEARADRNAEAANSEGPAIGRSKQPDAVKEHYFGPRLQAEFCFAPGFRPLNHGSYGAPPKAVVAAQRSWADQAEGRPDAFLRMYFPAQLPKIRSLVADVVKCDREDLVLVPNATTAMNAVLRSQSFATGDRIVYFSTTYAAIKKLVHFVCQTTPAESVCIELTYPTTTAAILRAVEAELLRGGVKVAIIDTISSMPALRLPFEKLIGLCRQHGCLSLIDGAHGVGAIPIDLKAWHPDYFTSNLHKWYFAPRATALLYVARGLQPAMQSPVISHGWNPAPAHTTAGGGTSNGTVSSTQISDGGGADWNAAGAMGCNVDEGPEPDVGAPIGFGPLPGHSAFEATFSGHGTADVSQVMAVRDAVEFRRRCGGDDVIFNYLRRLAVEGGAVTARVRGPALSRPAHLCILQLRSLAKMPPCALNGIAVRNERVKSWS
mmetsp:Transcript_8100/g.24062  ORF Transcript_8100/g.24062 Transcript_8100/m.24062 type:complete len:441 (+) Transcript_8100:234-1556(+)